MTRNVSFTIPYLPPSVNQAYVNLRGGGRTLSSTGKKFKNETKTLLSRKYPQQLKRLAALHDEQVLIRARFYFPIIQNAGWPAKAKNRYKRIDLSNRFKLLEDVLVEVTGVDDSNNFVIILEKHWDPTNQRVLVDIVKWEDAYAQLDLLFGGV